MRTPFPFYHPIPRQQKQNDKSEIGVTFYVLISMLLLVLFVIFIEPPEDESKDKMVNNLEVPVH